MRELLQQLGVGEVAVVGHDLGCAVAQLVALEGGVRALALLDAAAFDAWPIEGVRMLQGARPQDETPEFVANVVELTLELWCAQEGRPDPRAVDVYRRAFSTAEGARAFFRAARAIDGVGLAGRERDLAQLDIPSLVVWGEEDPYLPPELGDRLADALPQSTLVLLPGCSHFVTEDASETVTGLVAQFLRSKYLGLSHGHDHAHGSTGPVIIPLERRGPA